MILCLLSIASLILASSENLILASSENVVYINTQDDLVVEALPFKPGPSINPKDGSTFSADSSSFLVNGAPKVFVSGEIHMARTPQSQWKEQLMRMKSGGLDMVAVYFFWIHHEEIENEFEFGGRRNVSLFLNTAKEVGLKVLARIGPWCHGEVRNGGHPDWLIERAQRDGFALRNNNTVYMSYVKRWYTALAREMKSLFFKDGGPIVAVQVDNETSDWKYLLALRTLALDVGIDPTFYTKTGWPQPNPGFPEDYPMLQFRGAYPDQFWTNKMQPTPNSGSYQFAPSNQLQSAFPLLDVEIGGGMSTAYNHRVRMYSEDMPSLHTVLLANGVNCLGYYMYHGGTNPHSLKNHSDCPESTLQESSFQLAGAQNPMNSVSYDFFAPLSEFGVPRTHYHQMRRLHLFLRNFGGTHVAHASYRSPNNSSLRWGVRSKNSSGFLFVNNHERLANLATVKDVRFNLVLNGASMSIPSNHSDALVVNSGTWFVWPFQFTFEGVSIGWATCQILCYVQDPEKNSSVLILSATAPGVDVEIAIHQSSDITTHGTTTSSFESPWTVVRNITPSTSSQITVSNLNIIVLPGDQADRVWKGTFMGRDRVFISDDNVNFVMTEENEIHLRANTSLNNEMGTMIVNVSMFPFTPLTILEEASSKIKTSRDGVFTRLHVPVQTRPLPHVSWTLRKESNMLRPLINAPSSKTQEPTCEDWNKYASEYDVTINFTSYNPRDELRLAVQYDGDSARFLFKDKLLADNWFSGYDVGPGQMEVGLSYLSEENPGLLPDDLNDGSFAVGCTLKILPLNRSVIDSRIYIQSGHWPNFNESGIALGVRNLVPLRLSYVTLVSSTGKFVQ